MTSIDFGTIDVNTSCGFSSYYIYGHGGALADSSYARAINMSISFYSSAGGTGSEAEDESWVYVSTPSTAEKRIASVGGPECYVGSVLAGHPSSLLGKAKVVVPATPATAGHVGFYLHHRYKYTG